MFIDARRLDDATTLRSAVCVVGGGVAGITLALEFERRGIDCIVLESGGFDPDDQTRDLARGDNAGLPYAFADGCRGRFLGGSSNCWGGWCRPLQTHDLEPRAWVNASGWPFDRELLTPYYERSHPILHLGPTNFDAGYWARAIDRPDVRRMPLAGGRVIDTISQFSPPVRFGTQYRKQLKDARHLRICLYANLVEIETDSSARTVRRLQARTLSGRCLHVEARQVVLATGGIENARLLLAACKSQPGGLGNSHDLVGRYFMDHPRLMLGNLRITPAWRRNKLYDVKFHYLNAAVAAHGTCVAAQLTLSPETQHREQLLNSQVWFASKFPGEGTEAAEAIIRMKHRLHAKVDPQHRLYADLLAIARGPISAANFVIARQLQPTALIKEVQFQMICEPPPDPASRVTLSDRRDRLGMPRARVDWRLGEQVKHTFDRTLGIVAEELRDAGIAEVDAHEPLQGRPWAEQLQGTWHHMGTTRMHDCPRQGVVDRDGRVHGMSNLHIAGSSVFPTAGANFPTITIVALALRLADHLAARLAEPEARLPGEEPVPDARPVPDSRPVPDAQPVQSAAAA